MLSYPSLSGFPLDSLAPARSICSSEDRKALPSLLYATLPLQSGSLQIRVLDLCCPKDVSAADDLTGTLRVVDLADSPAFTALSYVWGSYADNPDTLRCGGFDLPITETCREGLVALRQQYGAITIWVDAICINQSDDSEKASQIGLMEQIYTWASTAYIWLGPGDERSERAIKGLRRLSQTQRVTSVGMPWIDPRGRPRSVTGDVVRSSISIAAFRYTSFFRFLWIELGIQRFLRRRIPRLQQFFGAADLVYLLDRPWLQRVWTFQEVILSSNPVIVCGGHSISWRQLHQGLDYVGSKENRVRLGILHGPWGPDTPDLDWTVFSYSLNSDALARWRSLLLVWRSIVRPVTWNGRVLRGLTTSGGATGPQACSVHDYEEHQVKLRKILRAGSLLAVMCTLALESILVTAAVRVTSNYHLQTTHGGQFLAGILIALVVIHSLFAAMFFGSLPVQSQEVWTPDGPGPPDQGGDITLIGVLDALRTRQASRPEDKAFALHGVLRRLGASFQPVAYDKSLGRVYQELFRDLVRWRKSLVILLADVGTPLDGAPTWVPDWSTLAARQWCQRAVYSPIRNSEPNPYLLVEWRSDDELVVNAVLLGKSSYCSGPIVGSTDAGSTASTTESLRRTVTVLVEWIKAVRRDAPLGQPYESIPLAVFHCLRGREQPGDTETETVQVSEATFNDWYRIFSDGTQTEGTGTAPAADAVDAVLEQLRQNTEAREFTQRICEVLSGRRGLFLSRDGHIGSGPPHMERGDVIAIVGGVCMPLVLRPQGADAYSVVGPAFVCGFSFDVSSYDAAGHGRDWQRASLV
jgi:hypothetical protein